MEKSYFTNDEMKCKCCGKLLIDTEFKEKLNIARELAGFPFLVDSGYRCEAHNKAVGSTSTNHTIGRAADIKCSAGRKRYEIIRAMISAGMLGIGVGPDYVHCDTNRTTPALWTY